MPPNASGPQRRHTGRQTGLIPMVKTTTSKVKRAMTSPSEPTYTHKHIIPAYRLKWATLEEFLKKRFPEKDFPGITFEEKKLTKDKYTVNLPEALESGDLQAIQDLRDPVLNPLEREQSPPMA